MNLRRCSLVFLAVLSWKVVAEPNNGKVAPTFESSPAFHHRAFHSTIVLGDYLYIDGGEITLWNGAGDAVQTEYIQEDGDIITLPSNWTYSIDLSTSWTNTSVALNPIRKDSPKFNREALWLLGDKIYQYDGSVSKVLPNYYQNAPSSSQFWQFHPSGDSGHWTKETVITSPSRPRLVQVDQAYYASGNNVGFALGGIESDATVYGYGSSTGDFRRVPGLLMYNESSQTWSNASTKDFVYNEFAIQGTAQFVPNFGPEGILFVIGGMGAEDPSTSVPFPIPLDTAYMFEPVSKQWQKQKVTGDHPEIVINSCVVGLEGDDGTYEIFLYGGSPTDRNVEGAVNLGAVWVLSLPSFHWSRQPEPLPFGRWYHSCLIAGTNNRQMISVGGMVAVDSISQGEFVYGTVDRWDQGIGVFDMSDMEWKTSFSANTVPYVTPSLIKEYLKRNARYPSWDSDTVEEWFVKQARYTRSTSDGGSSGSTSTGAIAGGVVGGVAGLAIVCAIVGYILFRRKRRNRETAWDQQKDVYLNELDGSKERAEMSGKTRPAEHDGSPIHELEGRFHELEGRGRPNG